ncbi:MAG: SHOCT domain-containing protein [Desulfatiglandales bacterium]
MRLRGNFLPSAGLCLSLIFSASSAFAQRYGGWQHGMMDGWGMGWFGGIFMLVIWVLVVVGLIILIKWLVQSTREAPGGRSSSTSRALHILEERYARGEIEKQEFQEKKKDLL